MAVNSKEKELAAVGISVAAGCKPFANYHVKEARQAGASDEEMKQAAAAALNVREGATEIMRFHVLSRLGEGGEGGATGGAGERLLFLDTYRVETAAAADTVSAAVDALNEGLNRVVALFVADLSKN